MYPQRKRRRKASKGSVQIKSSNERLQLVFSYGGKRHYLSLGLPDTPVNQKVAEAKAKLIEADIAFERFDATLAKYKPQSALSTFDTDNPSQATAEPSLKELWGKFLEYKAPQCSPNTMYHAYGPLTGYVNRLPTHDLGQATKIRDFALTNFPIESCKRFIVRLNACCKWAVKSGLISENPFEGMATEIKPPKSQQSSEDAEIFPFTAAERDDIIKAIWENTFCNKHSGYKHSYYTSYIEFLFMTGCRPCEAIALQWKHISNDFRYISFEQAVISTRAGREIRQGLKTQERRRFPCNPKLQKILRDIEPENWDAETLVFPGYSGGILDTPSFRKSVWKPVLTGLGLEYRKPYQTRHTFITLALENGLDAKDVARLVGNSPEVIYRHYAGNKRELFVPEF